MSILEQFNTELPFPDVFPPNFKNLWSNQDYFAFRNLPHFCHVVSKLTQKEDDKCNMGYAEALRKLLTGESDFEPAEQESIRNLYARTCISVDSSPKRCMKPISIR